MRSLRNAIHCRPALALLALCLLAGRAAAEKTDVIYLRNGDRVTCEIKNVERGRLKASTDSMSTVYIEWKDIERVTSPQLFVVELEDGTRLEGSITGTTESGEMILADDGAERRADMARVVWVDPLKLDEQRIKRWDGSVSAGFDATKANSDTSLSASFDARRRAETFILNFNGSVYSRSQDGTEDTVRANFGGIYRGLLEDRWYWATLGSVERNDEQAIDLRTLGGAGYGRFLIQTGRTLWSATGGLVVTNEQRAGEESGETNLEGLLATNFEYFTYDTPKTSLVTGLTVFPSLTESGRVRTSLEVALRRELIEDLFVELSLYESYDRKPPEEGAKNDYGIVTSLGYTF